MQEYWTQPATYDPLEFDARFRPELLDVWLPHFVEFMGLAAQQRVLDLGCGTGGFAWAMAQRLQVEVIGVDVAVHLLRHAVAHAPTVPLRGVLGQAEALPLADQTVDRVLMSLVLHQMAHRQQALQEVYRVLRPGGRVLVRTVAPEVTLQAWVPFRFFPRSPTWRRCVCPRLTSFAPCAGRRDFANCRRARCVGTRAWTSTKSLRSCARENAPVIGCSPTRNSKTASVVLPRSGMPREGSGLIRNHTSSSLL
jgi:ubiquinone/menaquinone biosynthesis C-methylase UbiE